MRGAKDSFDLIRALFTARIETCDDVIVCYRNKKVKLSVLLWGCASRFPERTIHNERKIKVNRRDTQPIHENLEQCSKDL